jgi:integrase
LPSGEPNGCARSVRSLRDTCLIMVAYRHGLRAKEACELEWSQVEFGRSASLHVCRAKGGNPAVHPIRGDVLRMLTALSKSAIETEKMVILHAWQP